MPQISGSLRTITTSPSSVREVLVRAPKVRPSGNGVVLTEPVRVPVSTEGSFTVTLAVGAALLVVVDDNLVRESIPLLVTESTTTVAQAMQQAEDFSPEVHDRLAELAGSALGSVALVQGAAAKVAVDRSAVESASSQAVSANRDAQAAKTSAVEAWQGLRTRLDNWAENIELLTRWQPQYEWLRSNAASSFGVVQERITQAASEVVSQVQGLADQARRASDSAGTHETRARGYADRAASAATSAVTAEINKLKGSAPAAFDTLAEIADRIKAGGSLESELLRKIAEKASNADFQTLKSRVDRLGISHVSGLVSALAGKADASHRHSASDLMEATPNVIHGWLVKRDAAGRAQVAAPAGSTDIANKGYVDAKHMVLGPASGGSGVTARKTGRLVMVRVEGATAGNKGTLPAGYRPISTVDFFLTNPNSRSYPGWCNILTDGTVFVNFSNSSGSNSGYGVVTYISDS